MSTYTTYDLQKIRSRELLLASLHAMGYDPRVIEVHDQPQVLLDYVNKPRPEKATIIIRRRNTGFGASNDIGFFQDAKGAYQLVLSEYDRDTSRMRGKPFAETLQTHYKKLGADAALKKVLTTTIPRLKALGKIPANATVKRQTMQNGATRILVQY